MKRDCVDKPGFGKTEITYLVSPVK